jgi:sugar phosphate isomerase/epimerase
MRISLHHLTLADTSPAEFVDIAAAAGCSHVCLFVKVPGNNAAAAFPRVEGVPAARALKERLDGLGLSVWNVDTFMIVPGAEPAEYRETLEIAAALGAKTVNTLNFHPHADSAAAVLASFGTLAAQYGLSVVLEWYRFSKTNDLGAAVELARRTGQSNIALNVDILHLIRNGNRPADLAAVDPALLQYAQICDGPLLRPEEEQGNEAVCERNFPGEEEFPLVDFVRALPESAVLSIEAPVNRLRSSLTPLERARRAVAGTRKILAATGR